MKERNHFWVKWFCSNIGSAGRFRFGRFPQVSPARFRLNGLEWRAEASFGLKCGQTVEGFVEVAGSGVQALPDTGEGFLLADERFS